MKIIDEKQKTKYQTEFIIRESGEINFKGDDTTPEILDKVLDAAEARNIRFRKFQQTQSAQNQLITIVVVAVGLTVMFFITFSVVSLVKNIFFTPHEITREM